jgi:hypothetical protein
MMSILNLQFKLIKFEFIFAFALAIILFDRFRLGERIGVGEVLIALTVYISSLIVLTNYKKINIDDLGKKYVLTLIFFLFICIIPNTIFTSTMDLYSKSSLVDIFAYGTCFFFIASISFLNLNHNLIASIGLFLVCAFTLPFIGSGDAWYGDVRFSGGSDNPNRLAIYLLSNLALLSQLKLNLSSKLIYALVLSVLIYFTLSDAARLGYIAMILTFLFLAGIRSPYILPIYFSILVIFVALIILNFDSFVNFFINLWYAASTGNYRFNLITTGINAWLENSFTFLIGHGAGSFAGFAGPYEGWEAHSTPIDILTIGGIFFAVLFYCPLIYSIFCFIKLRNNFAASCLVGLIIFSLFTFVARHPIIWFVIYCSLMNCKIKEIKN